VAEKFSVEAVGNDVDLLKLFANFAAVIAIELVIGSADSAEVVVGDRALSAEQRRVALRLALFALGRRLLTRVALERHSTAVGFALALFRIVYAFAAQLSAAHTRASETIIAEMLFTTNALALGVCPTTDRRAFFARRNAGARCVRLARFRSWQREICSDLNLQRMTGHGDRLLTRVRKPETSSFENDRFEFYGTTVHRGFDWLGVFNKSFLRHSSTGFGFCFLTVRLGLGLALAVEVC